MAGDSSSTAFSPEQRTFQLADGADGAEAWLRAWTNTGPART